METLIKGFSSSLSSITLSSCETSSALFRASLRKTQEEILDEIGEVRIFLGDFPLERSSPRKDRDAYDLKVFTACLKSKRETVLSEDLARECGFAAEESFQ